METFDRDREDFASRTRVLLDRGMYDQARDLAEARLAEIPGDVEARLILCEALWGMGYDEEAQEVIAETEEIIRGYSEIYRLVGRICRDKGLAWEAIRYYERFIALNPHSPLRPEIEKDLNLLRTMPGADRGEAPPTPVAEREPPPSPMAMLDKWLANLESKKKGRP
ncbi:MAG: tetratricopeptide repeat protein [Pseudomonadota bacterium]|nr:tetratricopeptide repeat protein [Pseudomonadota bacterium]